MSYAVHPDAHPQIPWDRWADARSLLVLLTEPKALASALAPHSLPPTSLAHDGESVSTP